MNFLKLKNYPRIVEYEKGPVTIKYGNIIQYSKVSNLDYLKEILLPEYRDDFFLTVMDISGNLPPHIDNGILTTINFYIACSGYVTQFYDVETEFDAPYAQGDGRTYDLNLLRKTDSFIAQDGDAWVLNVRVPHSISSLSSDQLPRTAIVMQTRKHSFDRVIEMISTV